MTARVSSLKQSHYQRDGREEAVSIVATAVKNTIAMIQGRIQTTRVCVPRGITKEREHRRNRRQEYHCHDPGPQSNHEVGPVVEP